MTSLPTSMNAVEITAPGGPEVLKPCMRPVPTPKNGEVLIKVEAAGINRPDIIQRKGLYPVPPDASDLPGLEVAGTIVAVGDGISDWQVGDEVCALTHGGGYANYVSVAIETILPIPKGLSMAEAACLPETFFTVWNNVFKLGGLKRGETLLVHGGSSGIGYTAIQMAKAFGAKVVTTAGSKEKCDFCKAQGADLVINYRDEDFVETIKKDIGGVDVVLDMVAGDYLQKNMDVLKKQGRLVIIGLLGGPKTDINVVPILGKRLTITGSLLRPQTLDQKKALRDSLLENVWPLLEYSTLKPVIHAEFPLNEANKAHELMESSSHMGKIVLLRE